MTGIIAKHYRNRGVRSYKQKLRLTLVVSHAEYDDSWAVILDTLYGRHNDPPVMHAGFPTLAEALQGLTDLVDGQLNHFETNNIRRTNNHMQRNPAADPA